MFKPRDRIQEEAGQAKTTSMAEQAAAGKTKQQQAKEAAAVENSWASCHNMNQKRDSKKRLTNRIVKCSSPTQRKTPTASSKM